MPNHTDRNTDEVAARLRTVTQLLEERPALRTNGSNPERWLRRLIYERRIPYHKVRGRVLVDLADVDAFLEGDFVPAAG